MKVSVQPVLLPVKSLFMPEKTMIRSQDAEHARSSSTSSQDSVTGFRLNTQLPIQISWRNEHGIECEAPAVLREVTGQQCRIHTNTDLTGRSTIWVQIRSKYLVCLVQDIELAPPGFAVKMLILPTESSLALLRLLKGVMAATTPWLPTRRKN